MGHNEDVIRNEHWNDPPEQEDERLTAAMPQENDDGGCDIVRGAARVRCRLLDAGGCAMKLGSEMTTSEQRIIDAARRYRGTWTWVQDSQRLGDEEQYAFATEARKVALDDLLEAVRDYETPKRSGDAAGE